MRFAPTAACCVMMTLLSGAAPADACINAVEMTRDQANRHIALVEYWLEREQFYIAHLLMPVGKYGHIGTIEISDWTWHTRDQPDRLEERLVDIEYVLDLRWRGEYARMDSPLGWFEHRTESPYIRTPAREAWLAEALVANGHTGRALGILRKLEERDVMPDARAYLLLANLTTGEERYGAVVKCHTRATVKSICPPLPITT